MISPAAARTMVHVPSRAMPPTTPLKHRVMNSKRISLPMVLLGTCGMKMESLKLGLQNKFSLDTAKVYDERIVGTALSTLNIPQASCKLITKLCEDNLKNEAVLREAVLDSTQKLGRIPDLFLIHAPYTKVPMLRMLRELENMKASGTVKEWGVSNFDLKHLKFLVAYGFFPSLNQREFHPLFRGENEEKMEEFCKEHDIIDQAYRPLAKGELVKNSIIKEIASKYGVKEAVIAYSWFSKLNKPIVTQASKEEHQKDLEVNLIDLSHEEMGKIAGLHNPNGRTCTKGGWYPFNDEYKSNWLDNFSSILNKKPRYLPPYTEIPLNTLAPLKTQLEYSDALNCEGGKIAKENPGIVWGNGAVVLDCPHHEKGVNYHDLAAIDGRKDIALPGYNEVSVLWFHTLIMKYYINHAHEISKKNPSDLVKIVIQIHRGNSGIKYIPSLEKALKICFDGVVNGQLSTPRIKNEQEVYNIGNKNVQVSFRWGYTPETIGNYEGTDIVLSLSLVAGFAEDLQSGSFVLPNTFIPLKLNGPVKPPELWLSKAYTVKNNIEENLVDILAEQTPELLEAVNKNFVSINPDKAELKASWLTPAKFKSAVIAEANGIYNPDPKELPAIMSRL